MQDVQNAQSMSNQPIAKLFWLYTIPAVMGMIVQGLYALIDAIFIGQYVGKDGLAALNLSWPVFGLIIGTAFMIGTGTSALYSIERGADNHRNARRVIGNVFILIPLASTLLGSLIYSFGSYGLTIQLASGDALTYGTEYLNILSIGALPAMAGAVLPMLIRNDERPHLATVLMVVGAGSNVFLDWLFVVFLDQGVAGAAIATVIAQSVITVWGVGYFFSSKAKARMRVNDLVFDARISWQTLGIGFATLIMFLYYSFVLVVHNRLFLEYGSVVILAAFTIVGYIQAFYYMFSEGVGHGIQPLVSFNKGANNHQNISDALLLALKVTVSIGVGGVLIINLVPDYIAGIFTSGDQELIDITILGLRLHLFSMFLDGFIVVSAAYFQALAMSRLATFVSIGNMLIQLPLLVLLPKWLGVTGVWIALPVSNIFLSTVVAFFVIRDLRLRKTLVP